MARLKNSFVLDSTMIRVSELDPDSLSLLFTAARMRGGCHPVERVVVRQVDENPADLETVYGEHVGE